VARLLAPTNIQCVPVDSGRIDISWSLPSKGNFTLKIEKRIDSGSYYTLAVLDSNIHLIPTQREFFQTNITTTG